MTLIRIKYYIQGLRFRLGRRSMQQENQATVPTKQNKSGQTKDYKYYQPSEKEHGRFKLRFPEIINSLVDANPLQTIGTLLKWKWNDPGVNIPKDQKKLQQQLPIYEPLFPQQQDKIFYTWIGHSTAVISIGKQCNIIIDPVFSQRASPYQWIGPQRFRKPACTIKQLPNIDLVLVSHDHYDHLDQDALQKLYERFPKAKFVAGLGSNDVFPSKCNFHELDWTKSQRFVWDRENTEAKDEVKVTFVPVCHWGRRGAIDKNQRLWGGFVIETAKGKKIFYSGDTGMCGVFEELGKQFQGFDISILPIGAYEPREYLKNQHINPDEAVQVHKLIKSKKSVGVHWGTFPLGTEHYTAARTDLEKAVQQHNLEKDEFITVAHGAGFAIDY